MRTTRMRSTRRTTAVTAFAFLLTLGACSAETKRPGGNQEQFTATLSGANERPDAVTSPGSGTADLSFTGTGPITYSISVSNLSSVPQAAHIHGPADASASADVVVTFSPISPNPSGTLVSGTIADTGVPSISLDSLKALLRNGQAYINVHTANFPNGEVRGQVTKK